MSSTTETTPTPPFPCPHSREPRAAAHRTLLPAYLGSPQPENVHPPSKDKATHFIITTPSSNTTKPDAETLKFIRSYVSRGRGKRQKLKRANRSTLPLLGADIQDRHNNDTSITDRGQVVCIPTPRKTLSEFSCMGLLEGAPLKPYMLDLLYQIITVIQPATYITQDKLVDQFRDYSLCLASLPQHPALTHSLIFSVQALRDLATRPSYGAVARFHLNKTLQHLQTSLSDRYMATDEATMVAVISLATATSVLDKLEVAGLHLQGLHHMVMLRGGIHSLGAGSLLERKVQRLDLTLSMATGHPPRFFRPVSPWIPQIASERAATRFPELDGLLSQPADRRLTNLWADVREFIAQGNVATSMGSKITAPYFFQFSTLISPRLFDLEFTSGSTEELLRLCMIACVKVILVDIRGIASKMTYLADGLKSSVEFLRILWLTLPSSHQEVEMLLWAIFVTQICVCDDFQRDWLESPFTDILPTLGLKSWSDVRGILKKFLWLDAVFDEPGKKTFERWSSHT